MRSSYIMVVFVLCSDPFLMWLRFCLKYFSLEKKTQNLIPLLLLLYAPYPEGRRSVMEFVSYGYPLGSMCCADVYFNLYCWLKNPHLPSFPMAILVVFRYTISDPPSCGKVYVVPVPSSGSSFPGMAAWTGFFWLGMDFLFGRKQSWYASMLYPCIAWTPSW